MSIHTAKYRLKQNYKNYPKGCLLYYDNQEKVYHNRWLSRFKKVASSWVFLQHEIDNNPDIFEEIMK